MESTGESRDRGREGGEGGREGGRERGREGGREGGRREEGGGRGRGGREEGGREGGRERCEEWERKETNITSGPPLTNHVDPSYRHSLQLKQHPSSMGQYGDRAAIESDIPSMAGVRCTGTLRVAGRADIVMQPHCIPKQCCYILSYHR